VNHVKRCTILIGIALMGWASLSYGETLFLDDFENGLSKWVGKSDANPEGYAKLVDDPLNQGHGQVVTFTSLVIEGAIYTKELLRNRPDYKPYILSFDYLGLPKRGSRNNDYGGYIGYSRNSSPGPGPQNHRWVGGTNPNYTIYRGDQYIHLEDNGQWNHYEINMSATDFPDFFLMLEDYSGAGGVSGDAYFDNIMLTDSRGPAPAPLTLTIRTEGSGSGNVISSGIDCGTDCTEEYTSGTQVTLIPTPDEGSLFRGWTGSGCSNSFAITSDMTCTATFVSIPRLLQVRKEGAGTGNVSSQPRGINCGSDCSQLYRHGTPITLVATPDDGSQFGGFSGPDCSDSFTITQDMTCTATFTKVPRTLKIEIEGPGGGEITVEPRGLCKTDCSEMTYEHGTPITLVPKPDDGSQFGGFKEPDCSNSFTITTDMTCTATFTKVPRQLEIEIEGPGTGQITSQPSGIDCGIDCSQTYEHGTPITLVPKPDEGSQFGGFSGPDCSDSFTITKDMRCTATFTKVPRQLNIEMDGPGSGQVTSQLSGIDCGTDCSQTYEHGTKVILNPKPDEGSQFVGWTGSGCSDFFNITQDMTCTATFTKVPRQLTIETEGPGSGQVTSQPSGIDCGSDCSQTYEHGTPITLVPKPDEGSQFGGFSGPDCSDSFTITKDMTCTATFTKVPRQLTIETEGPGSGQVTSQPSGIDCGSDCSQTYENGTPITLVPKPDEGSQFGGFSGPDCSDSFTITKDMTCTATFTKVPRQLTIETEGPGSGKVTSVPPGIDCGSDCSQTYENGTPITLVPKPDDGSQFGGWKEPDCSNSITITKDMTCTATFTKVPRQLEIEIEGPGTGQITSQPSGIDCGSDCSQTYENGTPITLVPKPDDGSQFGGWKEPDCSDSFTITKDMTCTATFTKVPRQLTIETEGPGSGKVTSVPPGIDCGSDCSQTYENGTPITLVPKPDDGSQFGGWKEPDCSNSITITKDMTCTATFTKVPRQLTIETEGPGTGQITSQPSGIDCGSDCSQTYENGTPITLVPKPDDGSQFGGWKEPDCSNSITITKDMTCTATFTKVPRQLTIETEGPGTGQITSQPSGIDCGSDCSQTYENGTPITLVPKPDDGSQFGGWKEPDCSNSITITKDMTCTATFTKVPRTLKIEIEGPGGGQITVEPRGLCKTDCSEMTYEHGTPITLVPKPDDGSQFGGWKEPDCSNSITITKDMTCTATFTKVPRQLTIETEGPGSGDVTSQPTGIDCGSDCSQMYENGTPITLVPKPDDGSQFGGFSGSDCSDSFTITKDMTCTATFTKVPHLFQVKKEGTGSGHIATQQKGIDCGNDCSQIYRHGTPVTLVSTPDEGSQFSGWKESDCSNSITITKDMTCTATFTKVPRTLNIEVEGDGSGKITIQPSGDCDMDCSEMTYEHATPITIVPKPDDGSQFGGWKEPDCSDSFTITKDMTCTAIFTKVPRLLTIRVEGKGSGQISSQPDGIDCGINCSQSYEHGTSITLVPKPEEGSQFNGWTGPDCANSFTITKDMRCTATFTKIPRQLLIKTEGTGSGQITSQPDGIDCGLDCSQSYEHGTTVTLSPKSDENSQFGGWTGPECSESFTITKDMTCTATFTKVPRTLKIEIEGPGGGEITVEPRGNCETDCSEMIYEHGTPITLVPKPDDGSQFGGWKEPDCSNSITITKDMTCTATFTKVPRTLKIEIEGPGSGEITVEPRGDCETACSEMTYEHGTKIILVPKPDDHSQFVGWTGTNCTESFIITSDMTCTATFKPKMFTLNIKKGGEGDGHITSQPIGIACSPDCEESYVTGTFITLVAKPDENSVFQGWKGANCSESLIMTDNMTCEAIFEPREDCQPVDFNVGMTFSAKFPDKEGKYYIIPAEVIDALIEAISKGAEINIEKQTVCEPENELTPKPE
jgi:hypothetical protein